MQIRPAERAGIEAGTVDLAFRRWDRARLRVGTRMRTRIGLVEVTSVDEVGPGSITEAEAARAGSPSRAELVRLLAHRPDTPVFRVGMCYAGADPRIALRGDGTLTDPTATSCTGAWTASTPRALALGRHTAPASRETQLY